MGRNPRFNDNVDKHWTPGLITSPASFSQPQQTMNQYYSTALSESLQEIAKETQNNNNKAVSAEEVTEYFRKNKIKLSNAASPYLKKQREYREKAASANFGTY